jgi:4-hydroxy-tetrahydrodipicolinate synthase
MSVRSQLTGTGVALVTPFAADGSVDFGALGRLIDYVLDGGVDYLVSLGTTGEVAVLDEAEQVAIMEFTYRQVAGRVPVVVGIGGNDTKALVKKLQSYPLQQAAAVLSASPYYSKPSQQGIYEHYKVMAEASPKPIILYNVPGRTASNLTADTTLRLAQVPNIAGIKEASGNMVQCMHILHQRPEHFLVTSGDDHLTLPLLACGMDGVISVTANCFPRIFSDMVRHALRGDFAAARPLHYQCLRANDLLFAENNPAGAKAFLYEMGLIQNVLRLPVVPLSEAVHQQVKNQLASMH